MSSFSRLVSAPLWTGTVELEGGSNMLGFLCDGAATQGQRDIPELGGWRAYLRPLAGRPSSRPDAP